MLELLDVDFAPLGDAAHTLIDDSEEEYAVYDDRGYFWMHSMLKKGEMHAEKYLKQQSARITLLKRKLLSELRTGNKIYVCKSINEPVTNALLNRMSTRLLKYGNNLLLGIRLADSNNPPGALISLSEHIVVGHVAFMFANEGSAIDYENWKAVLTKAFLQLSKRKVLLE